MERAGVQQEAALETAAPPTVKRQQEQHIQAPAYISPRDPRLQLSGLADMQAGTTPAQPLHPGSVAAAVDSGSPVSADSEQGQAESSDRQASPTQAACSEGQQGVQEQSQRQCSHCGIPIPDRQGKRHPTTRALLCHACGDYARKCNGRLPSADLLQRRELQRQVVAASRLRHVPSHQRQCLQCGASTSGAGCHWHRHPATKEEWLCNACYQRAHRQLKRKRAHEAATAASSSDGEEESWEEGEQARPPSQAPAASQQQAALVQPALRGPPVQHRVPATNVSANGFAEAGQRQHLQALRPQQQQPQGANPDAAGKTVPEQPALLPLQTLTTQASTGLLVLEAAQQAAAAAAGLTEGLAGTFVVLLPMPAEQDECLRLMLQRRQYSGAAGLMRAVLHVRGIPALGLSQARPEKL